MKNFSLIFGALTVVSLVGCNSSEQGGKTTDRTPSKETFKISAPSTATTIKQGDKQTIKLTVSRGNEFKEALTLQAEPSTGISVEFEPKKIMPNDPATATATVSVANDAPLGNHTVAVKAKPETGNAAHVDFTVKVEKK